MAVTIPGPNSSQYTVTTGGPDVLNLANMINDVLSTLEHAGGMAVASDPIGGSVIPPASAKIDGQTSTLLALSGATSFNATNPAGYDYVLYNGSTPASLTGTNVNIVSG